MYLDPNWLLIGLGGFAGGFVGGLSGFGSGLVGMPFWLVAVSPVVAAQLAALSAVISQGQSLGTVRGALNWRHLGPITVAGMIAVPAGVWLLPYVPVDTFKITIGGILIVFCLFLLVVPAHWRLQRRRRVADVGVGIVGGFLGGLAGVPGPPVIMWGTVQNWSRENKRALYQVFNPAILILMLIASAVAGLMTWSFLWAALVLLPATAIGTYVGERVYHRLDDRRFDRIVLSILLLSGIGLIALR